MVTLFTIIKLASGVVPKRILDKHVISPKKVLAMDLNPGEAVQAFGLSIAALCALYPLGNYGAEGDFGNRADGKGESMPGAKRRAEKACVLDIDICLRHF